jgi:serine/threonine-protein kinase
LLQAGDQIDVWVVDRPLGQGGMGSVYQCHNREAKRILAAVKVLDPSLQRVPHAKARFVREAEILFGLDHPHIVKVRNVRMDLATPYLEMEFVDGQSLEERVRAGALSAAEALPLLRQVADALVYLHARGVRHRDVKPSNLLVQAGEGGPRVKLVDFGIATESDAATITERGQTFGSVPYAPPEWLDPEHLDPVRWDIYSTGVVFFELLTGRPAFPIGGAVGTPNQWVVRVMTAKQHHPPLDPGPDVPVALRALIRDMTRARWQDRLADAREVLDRLAAVDLADVDPELRFPDDAAPAPTWYPDAVAPPARTMVPDVPPAPPRARLATALGMLAVAGIVGAAGVAFVATRPASPPAPVEEPVVAAAAVAPSPPPVEVVAAPPPEAPPAPVAPPAAEATAPVTPKSKSVSKSAAASPATEAGAAARAVTTDEFARWLSKHPEWQRDAAVAAGKADDAYLKGWDGATPPAGAGRAMVYVSWSAARAYCAGRGGLAALDAPPLTWTEGASQPWHEYRRDGVSLLWGICDV